MEIKINLDETRFKDVLDNELKAFNKEELHDIIRQAMLKFLNEDASMRELFLHDETDRWETVRTEPTAIFRDLIKTIDISPIFEETKKKLFEFLTKEDTIKNLCFGLFSEFFIDGFSKTLIDNNNFRGEICNMIRQEVYSQGNH